MGKKNKRIKQKLIEIYGEDCMFEKADIATRISQIGGIRTYSTYLAGKKFKGQPIKKQLTYHHLEHKEDGGKATVENGALIGETAHEYIHSLPREQEEIINNMLRAYKINFLELNNGQVLGSGNLAIQKEMLFVSIPIETDEIRIRRARVIYKKQKQKEFNRSKIKKNTQRQINEYWKKQGEGER